MNPIERRKQIEATKGDVASFLFRLDNVKPTLLETRDMILKVQRAFELQDQIIEERRQSNVLSTQTERAYLRVLQEFIAAKGDPDLSALNSAIGALHAQALNHLQGIESFIEMMRKHYPRDGLNAQAAKVLDEVEFHIMHEAHRRAHYIAAYVVRDLRLAFAGLTEASFKNSLGERPEAPETQDPEKKDA